MAATEPRLGTAANFAILAATTITNTGLTVINGDLGLDPGTSVTGFPPGVVTAQHIGGTAVQAKSDLAVAYNDAALAPPTSNLTGQDLGGMTLSSGVYKFNSSAQLTGNLTLTGTGVFIFQIGSTITTASNSEVLLAGGAQACAVYWQVGSSATLGTGTQFQGNLMALTSITMTTGASIVTGRAMAQNAAVTLDTNAITKPTGTCVPVPPPSADIGITKTVSNASPSLGSDVTFTITATNHGPDNATGVQVTDLLPAGLTFVSATPSMGTYDSGTGVWNVVALANGGSATLSLAATVTATATLTNTATKTAEDQIDPVSGNDSATATVTAMGADIAITKTVDNAAPNLGSNVTFTITATNHGPGDATGVQVTDLLPAGLTLISATTISGTYSAGVWNIGALANAGSATLAITATVNTTAAVTNTATKTAEDQVDPVSGNNSASATLTALGADIAITKTVDDPTPNLGSNVTFTITATNNGPGDAAGVQVTDLLPAGLNLVSATTISGAYSGGVWNIGPLANAGSATLAITATVNSAAPVTNTATKTAEDQLDPVSGNNSASATINPVSADIAITKTVDNSTPNLGSNVTFTITSTNHGPSDATGVRVTDLLPAGLTLVSATTVSGTYTAGVWNIGPLANGGTATLSLVATVTGTATITNTATKTAEDQVDPASANNSATATLTALGADIAITKTVDNAAPNLGSSVTFTITATNNGPGNATGVQVTDLLPAGLTLVSATTITGTYSAGVWNIGALANGGIATLAITATVNATAAVTNTATKTAEDQVDPVSSNNSASATLTALGADIATTKTVDNPTPNLGSSLTFTITATNNGPGNATGVQVTDVLPAGLTLVSATTASGTYTAGVWNIGPLANGLKATLTIVATVTVTAAVTNTATKTAEDQVDPVTGNNSATATVIGQAADIAITKTVDNPAPNLGSNVTFTITATNNGPSNATGVQVTDLLPAGLTLVSATTVSGTYSAGVWNIGPLANGGKATLLIVATVTGTAMVTNTATKAAEDQVDPVSSNNSASATLTALGADIAIAKTVDNPAPNLGSNVTFTITATNNGPGNATGVQVTDVLPAGLSLVSATTVSGTYSAGVWNIGPLANGAKATLLIVAAVTVTTAVTNTATNTAEDQVDAVSSNNSATATVTGQAADIVITKTVSDPTPNLGSNITFVITATNNGPSNATGVAVTDTLPAGLNLVSATTISGTYTAGVWNIGALANGAKATLSLVATVNGTAAVTNTAAKTAEDQPDLLPSNDSASVLVTGQAADIAITKSVDNPTPNLGSTITFTVTATNNGPSNATGVQVTDVLPAGLSLVSATTISGTYSAGVWNIGALANGAKATLSLVATVTGTAAVNNTATKTAEDQPDSVPANNSASTTINPVAADIAIIKTVDNPTPNVGSNVTFTITATNNGPSNATGVQVTDTLPAGLTLVSATTISGTYTAGVWNIGALANGAKATLSIMATVTGTSAVTNTAAKTTEVQPDQLAGNDSASVTVAPDPPGLPGLPNTSALDIDAPWPGPNAPDGNMGLMLAVLALVAGQAALGLAGIGRRRNPRLPAIVLLAVVMSLAMSSLSVGDIEPNPSAPAAALAPGTELIGSEVVSVAPPATPQGETFHRVAGPIMPSRLRIPSIGVDTSIDAVGLRADGSMDVPDNLWTSSWLADGPRPGQAGNAVIAGHRGVGSPALFSHLEMLRPGDRIYVSDAAGNELIYVVTRVASLDVSVSTRLAVFGPAAAEQLVLVTCFGRYIQSARTYDHRLVVFSQPLPLSP